MYMNNITWFRQVKINPCDCYVIIGISDSVQKTLANIRTLIKSYFGYRESTAIDVDDLPSINPLPNDGILNLTNLKAIADDKINVSKMVISVLTGPKTFLEKKRMLIDSIFSNAHNVFRSLLLGLYNSAIRGKGLSLQTCGY